VASLKKNNKKKRIEAASYPT